jgi:hypothetical protein
MYRHSQLKVIQKALEDDLFPFVIIDAPHLRVSHFETAYRMARQRHYEVYIVELRPPIDVRSAVTSFLSLSCSFLT